MTPSLALVAQIPVLDKVSVEADFRALALVELSGACWHTQGRRCWPALSLFWALHHAEEPIDPSVHPGNFLWRRQGTPYLMSLIASGQLTALDVTVLLQLGSRVRPASGYSVVSLRTLAAERRASLSSVAHSVRRLIRAGLVCRVRHKNARPAAYAINPSICATGSAQACSMSAKAFDQAMREAQPPAPVTEAAVKARHALAAHLPGAS